MPGGSLASGCRVSTRRVCLIALGTELGSVVDLRLLCQPIYRQHRDPNSVHVFIFNANASTVLCARVQVPRLKFMNVSRIAPNRVCCNALLAAYARAKPPQWEKVRHQTC